MACRTCARDFISDGSSLAIAGYCMMCRADVDGTCTGCGHPAKGAPDGKMICRRCRHATWQKNWLYADTTGGRLWRHTIAGMSPDFEEEHTP